VQSRGCYTHQQERELTFHIPMRRGAPRVFD
jgi:hypothetical protein